MNHIGRALAMTGFIAYAAIGTLACLAASYGMWQTGNVVLSVALVLAGVVFGTHWFLMLTGRIEP